MLARVVLQLQEHLSAEHHRLHLMNTAQRYKINFYSPTQILSVCFNICNENTDRIDVGRAVVCVGDISTSGSVDTLLGVQNCVIGIEAHHLLFSSCCECNRLEESNGNATVLEEGPGLQECQLLQLENRKQKLN